MTGLRKLGCKALLGALFTGMMAISASAAPYSCGINSCGGTVSTGTLSTELGTAGTPLSLAMPLFNSALGTLTSATITFSGTMIILGTSTLTNTALGPQTFNANEDVKYHPGSPTAGSIATALASFGAIFIDPAYSQNYVNLAPNTPTAFGPNTTTSTFTMSNAGPFTVGLGEVQVNGGGTQTITVYSITSQGTSGAGGNVTETFDTQGQFDVTVAYNFTPAAPPCQTDCPEPASMALLVTGLAGITTLRRRRKA